MPAPSRIMSGPPEPSLLRLPYLSKIAASSAQRAASCSFVCCAWGRESGGGKRQQQERAGEPHHQILQWVVVGRGDTIRASRCEVVLRKPSGDRMKGER